MRKLFITILLCFVSSQAWAFPPGFIAGVTASAPVGGSPVYTDCSNIGTASFMWTGEHTTGNSIGCKISGTVTPSVTGVTFVDSASDPAASFGGSGGIVAKGTANSQQVLWSGSASELINGSEGEIVVTVYFGAISGGNSIVRTIATNDEITLAANSTGKITFLHIGGNGTQIVNMASTASVSAATPTVIRARWSVANNQIAVKVGDNAWQVDEDTTPVTAFTVNPTYVRALSPTITNPAYLNDIYVYPVSGL